jgi:cytochrome c-type biogenesis protein CcmH/NrfG
MQVAAMEAAAADLHEQMLASSELIKALAEQNTQLIRRVEANRVRVLWLAAAMVVVGVVAAASLALTLAR